MTEREPGFKRILRRRLGLMADAVKNPVILDIGANLGDYVFLMNDTMNGKPYQLIAIEPNPEVFKALSENMDFFGGKCELRNLAISDKTGETDFYIAKRHNLGSVVFREGISTKKIRVQSSTIPDLGVDKIDFIKMDIEGGEVFALRGAREYLAQAKNMEILMEIHPGQYTKELNLQTELEHLFDNGWHCRYMISSGMPEFYSPYRGLKSAGEIEVKPGWKRYIFVYPPSKYIFEYGCWESECGVPSWRGTVSHKLMRGLLLVK